MATVAEPAGQLLYRPEEAAKTLSIGRSMVYEEIRLGRLQTARRCRPGPVHGASWTATSPRRPPSWRELLDSLETGFARAGVARDTCLPLRWGRETEPTISAVQALDPLLKDGQLRTYRSGFLPQPVVRFTGPARRHRPLEGRLSDLLRQRFRSARDAAVPLVERVRCRC